MNESLVVVKQLPVIEEQLKKVEAEITNRVNDALALVCTEETVKSVKAARADLNAQFKEWEDKRKQIKKQVLSPYEQFESVYQSCVSNVYKRADVELKQKIEDVESSLKESKRTETLQYFEEYRKSLGIDFVDFGKAGISITLSASSKSLREKAKAFLDKIHDDLTLIGSKEHKSEILLEYKESLNVSDAILKVANRKKALEQIEKKKETPSELTVQAERAEHHVLRAPVEVPEEESVLSVTFTVRATMPKLKKLKEFMNNGGYDYE